MPIFEKLKTTIRAQSLWGRTAPARTVARNQRIYITGNRCIYLPVCVAHAPVASDPPAPPVLPNFRWGSGVREGSWVSNSLNVNHLTRKWSDKTE
jgi:hypothetical protein